MTNYNKSQIMKDAWKNYKFQKAVGLLGEKTFGDVLRAAWAYYREEVEYAREVARAKAMTEQALEANQKVKSEVSKINNQISMLSMADSPWLHNQAIARLESKRDALIATVA